MRSAGTPIFVSCSSVMNGSLHCWGLTTSVGWNPSRRPRGDLLLADAYVEVGQVEIGVTLLDLDARRNVLECVLHQVVEAHATCMFGRPTEEGTRFNEEADFGMRVRGDLEIDRACGALPLSAAVRAEDDAFGVATHAPASGKTGHGDG